MRGNCSLPPDGIPPPKRLLAYLPAGGSCFVRASGADRPQIVSFFIGFTVARLCLMDAYFLILSARLLKKVWKFEAVRPPGAFFFFLLLVLPSGVAQPLETPVPFLGIFADAEEAPPAFTFFLPHNHFLTL